MIGFVQKYDDLLFIDSVIDRSKRLLSNYFERINLKILITIKFRLQANCE